MLCYAMLWLVRCMWCCLVLAHNQCPLLANGARLHHATALRSLESTEYGAVLSRYSAVNPRLPLGFSQLC